MEAVEGGGSLVKKFNTCETYREGVEVLKELFAGMGENVRVIVHSLLILDAIHILARIP